MFSLPATAAEPVLSSSPVESRADAPAWGPIAGSLTALVPLMVGSALMAQDDRRDLQRDGIYVMAAGFAAAPWVAHVGNRRWKRATAFGLLSLVTSAVTVASMSWRDPFDPDLANRKRVPFGVLLTSAFFAAAIGIIDGFATTPSGRERP